MIILMKKKKVQKCFVSELCQIIIIIIMTFVGDKSNKRKPDKKRREKFTKNSSTFTLVLLCYLILALMQFCNFQILCSERKLSID